MELKLKVPSGNPYANIDQDDDAGQPYYTSGNVMPWEKPSYAQHSPVRQMAVDSGDSSRFDLEEFARVLRAKPAGNPWAYVLDESEKASIVHTAEHPYAKINNDDDEAQPYLASGDTLPWEKASTDSQRSGRTGRDWALHFTVNAAPNKRFTDRQIEDKVRTLQRELWARRRDFFDNTDDPIRVLDPAKVFDLLDFRVRYRDGGLGELWQDGAKFDVAGLINPGSKVVEISTLPSRAEQIFTLTHELGHLVLGSMGSGVHRDRPRNGTDSTREPDERAADKFAVYFLMPDKLVRQIFRDTFLTDRFEFTEETAFALRAKSLDGVEIEFPTLRSLSRHLASTERYNGKVFCSLSSRFNVSEGAMAIRLEELGLVRR